ncbi:MAG: glucose-1-phosphate thymidylyltransferase [Bacteroidetes bacterium GWA2_31_9]|nr:MAG: glucose-1-phosphate thymidylyltransferase [Bacteroidetes bacterium GWA2_31_9]
MNYLLFDDNSWDNLLPLTFTRPVSELRIGILTIKEKWEKYLNTECSYITKDYLSEKYKSEIKNDNILINSSFLPNIEIANVIKLLNNSEAIVHQDVLLAIRLDKDSTNDFDFNNSNFQKKETTLKINKINYPWDLFTLNGQELESDFDLIIKNKISQDISKNNNLLFPERIFVEEGASVLFSNLNATNGPIYIGKDTEVMEGSNVRGPFALCEHSALKIGSKIYGPTTIGPHSKVGGEINNSIIIGYSNKAHDGFLGQAVIGEWCNIGADSNNSNLKNNYTDVRMWNYPKQSFIKTGLTFCGLIMGDHSKCGINTMFNTGTVIGVNSNIFGGGYPRNFIPSYSWGGSNQMINYEFNKAIEVAQKVMSRRNIELSEIDIKILKHIYGITEAFRDKQ